MDLEHINNVLKDRVREFTLFLHVGGLITFFLFLRLNEHEKIYFQY